MDNEDQKDIDEKLDDMELSIDSHPHNIPNDSLKIKRFKQNKSYSKMVSTFIVNPEVKRWWKRVFIWWCIIGLVLLILLIYFAIFELLKAWITWFGATIVLFLLHFILFRQFWMFSTYPGSYKIWLREVEYKFWKDTTYRVMQHIRKIRSIIETLSKEEIDLDEYNEALETMHRYRNQSRIHNTDHSLIINFHEKLQKTKISINHKTTTLWDLEGKEVFDWDQSNTNTYKIKFEDYPKNQISINLMNLWNEIIRSLEPYWMPQNIWSRIWAIFKYKPFGRLDQMRNELEVRFDGKQTWATSFDGKKIDWMLIPAVQNLNATITDYKSWPTMLICNPNAGFYEYNFF